MAKFCGSCGSQASDEAMVCGVCGTPFEAESNGSIPGVEYVSPEAKEKKKKIVYGVIGLAAVIIVVSIVVSIVSGFVGYKGAVRKIMNAYMEGDVDALLEMSSCIQYEYEYFESDLDSQVNDMLDYYEDEYGSKFKWSYKIVKDSVWSDRKFRNAMEEAEDEYGIDVRDISKIMTVDLDLTVKSGKYKEGSSIELVLSKEDGDWKLLALN